jgi:polar amino acid transport system substrate-binding protein
MTIPVTPALVAELAPTGTLRAALNHSNFLLVNKDSAPGDPRGVAVDVARELARRLGVPVAFVSYKSPGELADATKTGVWDVGFLGAEPTRANEIDFTAAYVEIEATYLVPANSPLRAIADVDREGVRISVSNRSAYELYLSRTIKHAQLVRVDGVDASYDKFVADKLDALAGLRPRLIADVKRLPGARILEGRFTAIQQAIGTPKGRPTGARYLREFAEDVKASGFVAQLIERHGAHGLTVAPKAAP